VRVIRQRTPDGLSRVLELCGAALAREVVLPAECRGRPSQPAIAGKNFRDLAPPHANDAGWRRLFAVSDFRWAVKNRG
jgi:hypothetical protein